MLARFCQRKFAPKQQQSRTLKPVRFAPKAATFSSKFLFVKQTPTTILFRPFSSEHASEGLRPTIPKATVNEITERVIRVVSSHSRVDGIVKVTAESSFKNDLGLDSLDSVEVILALEEEFAVEIPDHDAEKILTVPDAVKYLAVCPTFFSKYFSGTSLHKGLKKINTPNCYIISLLEVNNKLQLLQSLCWLQS